MLLLRLVAAAALTCAGLTAVASPVQRPHLQVELLADTTALAPAQAARLGIHFQLEDGWHVYWRNPGESGEAPSIEWSVPPGFAVGSIEWPTPHRIAVGPLMNYGYDGTVLLPVALQVPARLGDTPDVALRARVKWLVCDPEECIPGEADLELTLPVGTPAASPAAALFEAAQVFSPGKPPGDWRLAATAHGEQIILEVRGDLPHTTADAYFFPYSREAVEASAPQQVGGDARTLRLTMQRWQQSTKIPATLAGTLVVADQAYSIDLPFTPAGIDAGGLLEPLLLAFAGGILLNLMPCVFPVLALKALALVGLATEGRRRTRQHGLAYGIGVVVSFWVLAGVLLAARAGGEQLGWGFQLQSPVFVAALAALFFWMALILLGVSTIGASVMGIGDTLTRGDSFRSSFFTGVLATVVATPCTAPFMGTALGYALGQPAVIALAVFTGLGVGLALPYVAITFVPQLATWLPRPGAWMQTLEQLLAFPLLATVVWLVWVISLQGGPTGVAATLSILLLIAFATWATGRSSGRWPRVAAVAAVVIALVVGRSVVPSAEPSGKLDWQPYSAAQVEDLVAKGRPVFVDFTAAWCVTCQVNERVVLETTPVMNKMAELGVVLVRADWTKPNPEISRALQSFGRDGIPLYVLYSGRREDPPRILPQLLTADIVMTELEELRRRRET